MMYRSGYLRKFLVGATAVQAAACAADPGSDKTVRPSELPIYCPEEPTPCPPGSSKKSAEPSGLEKSISVVRKELWVYYDTCKGYADKIVEFIDTGKAHSESLIESLRQEELPIPRAGAVALSGLAGVVLGLRGGWIRRIFYGSSTAGIMAIVCYPKEFQDISQEAIVEGKKYAIITYNFINGVKPEGLTLPSPSHLLSRSTEETSKVKESPRTTESKSTKADTPVAGKQEDTNALKASTRTNDQSNPADKDLYSNRR